MAAHPRKQIDQQTSQQMKELEVEHQQEWASYSTIKENKPTSFRDVGRRCSMSVCVDQNGASAMRNKAFSMTS